MTVITIQEAATRFENYLNTPAPEKREFIKEYKNEFIVTPAEDSEYGYLWLAEPKDCLISVVDSGDGYDTPRLDQTKKYKVTVSIEEVE